MARPGFPRTGKQLRPKTAVKGKRYRCAVCRKRSPRPVKEPAPWYCPRCLELRAEDDMPASASIRDSQCPKGVDVKKTTKLKKPQHSPDAVFSFRLSNRQVEDVESEICFDAELMSRGIKQDDGSVRYEWSLAEIEDMLDFLAAACNHAEDAKKEARLDTIYRKLEKLVG